MKCRICRKIPKPNCDWRQGRCPHIKSMLQLTLLDKIIKFFKGKIDA
jgi:hypothetical protein